MMRVLGSRPSNQAGRKTEMMELLRLRGGKLMTIHFRAVPVTIC